MILAPSHAVEFEVLDSIRVKEAVTPNSLPNLSLLIIYTLSISMGTLYYIHSHILVKQGSCGDFRSWVP